MRFLAAMAGLACPVPGRLLGVAREDAREASLNGVGAPVPEWAG